MGLVGLIGLMPLRAADAPVVEVTSPAEVRVDGKPWGAMADTIANNPALAPAIQRAAAARWQALVQENADLQAKLAAAQAANAALVHKLQAAGTNAAALKAAVAEAIAPEIEAKRAVLRAELLRKQRELDELK